MIPHFHGPLKKNDALFLYGALQKHPFVFVYEQDHVEVVHGPSCRIDNEIIVNHCINDGVPITPRRTGGGTVVLAPGTIITIIVGKRDVNLPATSYFNMIHNAMIQLLTNAGINGIVKSGISDCAINQKKILGSSLYLGTTPRLYYYQSSLLVSSDLSLFDRYLYHPPREPSYRNKRPHGEFCTSLEKSGGMLSAREVKELFSNHLRNFLVPITVR